MVCHYFGVSTEVLAQTTTLKVVSSKKQTHLLSKHHRNRSSTLTKSRNMESFLDDGPSSPPGVIPFITSIGAMASLKRSPQHLNRGCMCNWGHECLKFKKLFAEAGHVSQMIPIKPGASNHSSVALRSIVKFVFKLGPEYNNTDFYVAAHHWPPSLIERNYLGPLSNRP